jgi:hypothetical protein
MSVLRANLNCSVYVTASIVVVTMLFVLPCFSGLRAIGCGYPVSFLGSFLINLVLSYPTQPVTFP